MVSNLGEQFMTALCEIQAGIASVTVQIDSDLEACILRRLLSGVIASFADITSG